MKSNTNMEKQLLKQLAYGTISKGDIPGQLEDFNAVLIKETYKNNAVKLKLKFTPKQYSQNSTSFYLNIDNVKQPANSLYLLKVKKTEDSDADLTIEQKISKKLTLSTKKQAVQKQQIVEHQENENDSDDSDIPKKKKFNYSFFRSHHDAGQSQESISRKRYKRSFHDDD